MPGLIILEQVRSGGLDSRDRKRRWGSGLVGTLLIQLLPLLSSAEDPSQPGPLLPLRLPLAFDPEGMGSWVCCVPTCLSVAGLYCVISKDPLQGCITLTEDVVLPEELAFSFMLSSCIAVW